MESLNGLNPETIPVAVVGAGAFGKNHARVYHLLASKGEQVKLAAVVDSDVAKADAIARPVRARGAAPDTPCPRVPPGSLCS